MLGSELPEEGTCETVLKLRGNQPPGRQKRGSLECLRGQQRCECSEPEGREGAREDECAVVAPRRKGGGTQERNVTKKSLKKEQSRVWVLQRQVVSVGPFPVTTFPYPPVE